MLTVGEIRTMILGQLGSKLGFWGSFCEFPRGNSFSGFPCAVYLTQPAAMHRGEMCWTTRVVHHISGLWGCFRTSPSVSFDVFWCCFN